MEPCIVVQLDLEGLSFAPKDTPSTSEASDTFQPKLCMGCGNPFPKRSKKRGRYVYKFCNMKCAGLYRTGKARKPVPKLECKVCGKEVVGLSLSKAREAHRENYVYCSPVCKKQFTSKLFSKTMRATNLKRRHLLSARMKQKNPTKMPGVLERISTSMRGRTFLSRGGNGQLTVPQMKLAELTGLPTEFAVITGEARNHFKSVPHCYKVDLACPEVKLAIEVDGNTHKTKRWKFLDARKTEILNSIGWTVLRFWNKEVMEDGTACAEKVASTISTLRAMKTTLPVAS